MDDERMDQKMECTDYQRVTGIILDYVELSTV